MIQCCRDFSMSYTGTTYSTGLDFTVSVQSYNVAISPRVAL